MPNFHFTSSVKINKESKIVKSSVLKLAWLFVKTEGVTLSYAMKRAWKETKGELERNFWTNASIEDVDYMIKRCSKGNVALTEKVRIWDSINIQHPLDWVTYQLERQGFEVKKVKADTIVKREIAVLNISNLKLPADFNRLDHNFNMVDNGLEYSIKGDYTPHYP